MPTPTESQPLADLLGVAPDQESTECEALLSILSSEGRPALLAHLKGRGLAPLGARQRVANAICRLERERAAAAPAHAPVTNSALAQAADLPLIFIHLGYQPYVEVAVRATALVYSSILVLGDASLEAGDNEVAAASYEHALRLTQGRSARALQGLAVARFERLPRQLREGGRRPQRCHCLCKGHIEVVPC